MIKILQKAGIEGTYLNIMKAIYDKPTANIILNGKKIECISPKVRNKTRVPTLTTTVQHSFGSFGHRNQRIKRNNNLYGNTKNLKDTTRKFLELINEYSKVAGYKINTDKSLAFLYTNSEKTEREIKKTIPFNTAKKE